MASSNSKKSRKGLAVGLAVLGVAGLSLAAASTLSLTSSAKFQAGSATISADCQGVVAIPVTFGAPTLATTGVNAGSYSASSVKFASIVAACDTLNYKVAIKTAAGWTDITPTTPAPKIAGTTLDVSIPTATLANDITGVSLTIYS
ncbi:hypothetical protein ASE38_02370 [Cellulomonas sp. Root930]|nr:hypothetical protein ASE38_02370 [Cellulomonas sp. Root930]